MNLRSMLCVAVAVGGMMGCGEPQKYYRVVVDTSPLRNLPASCYPNNTPPPPDGTNNLTQDVQQWVLWDGVEGRKYLSVSGATNYSLAGTGLGLSSEALVNTKDADKTTFVAERTELDPNRTYRVTYTFDNEGGLFSGEVLDGSIALSYTCTPTGAFTCNRSSCEATLRFSGRRIDAEPMILVGASGVN